MERSSDFLAILTCKYLAGIDYSVNHKVLFAKARKVVVAR